MQNIESKGTVEQYLDYHTEVFISYQLYFRTVVEIMPTEIVYQNGTSQTIYEVGKISTETEYQFLFTFFSVSSYSTLKL